MDATDIAIVSCHILCLTLSVILCLYNYLWELTRIRTSYSKHYLLSVGLYLATTAQYLYFNMMQPQPTVIYNNTGVTPLYKVTGSEVYCFSLRFSREYFLSLCSMWIVCELLHFCFIIWNNPETESDAKKIKVALYVSMAPYAVCYMCEIYNSGSCWDEEALNLCTSLRAIICSTVLGPTLLLFAAIKFVKRPNVATSGAKISYKKALIIFPITMLAYIAMIVTHSLWLGTNLINNELHEALCTLLLTTMHLIWIVFYSWGHGICAAVNNRLERYKRLRKLEKEMQELTRPKISQRRAAAAADSSV